MKHLLIIAGCSAMMCGCRGAAPSPSSEIADGWDVPCDAHGTLRNCPIGCLGNDPIEISLVDVLAMFSRISPATFAFNTHDVRGVTRDRDDLGIEDLSQRNPHWKEALSELLPKFGFTYRQDAVNTNLYHITKIE